MVGSFPTPRLSKYFFAALVDQDVGLMLGPELLL